MVRENKQKEKEGGNKETSEDPGLFSTAALPPPPHPYSSSCLFNAVLTKLSNGQFLATSFHFTFLWPLKVSFSIHFNNPGKLKVHLETHAFHMCLEAFFSISEQICPIFSHFIWPSVFNGLPDEIPAQILIPKWKEGRQQSLALHSCCWCLDQLTTSALQCVALTLLWVL